MVPREGGHTQIPRTSKGACLGLGILRQGGPRPASQPDGALGERVHVPGRPGSGSWALLFKNISKSWDGVLPVWNSWSQELGGKLWPPRGLSPKRCSPRSGRFANQARVSLLPEGRVGLWLVET